MPKTNGHYVAGPVDALVYAAADAAELPELAIAGFDGAALAWRWNVAPEAGPEARDILLRIIVAIPGRAIVEVSALAVSSYPRNRDRARLVGRSQHVSPLAIDLEWLAANLRKAHETVLDL